MDLYVIYQLISVNAIVRFCHLTPYCYLYLDELRAGLVAQDRIGATIGDAVRHQHKRQYRLLLQWPQCQFGQGCAVD